MTSERDFTPALGRAEPIGTLHALLRVHRDMLRGRLFIHFGDPLIERLAGFIEGYRACLRENGLPDPRYHLFCVWLWKTHQAHPLERDTERYLLGAGGHHEEAIRAYLTRVSEFSALPSSKQAKVRRPHFASSSDSGRAAPRDAISYLLQLRQDMLQGQLRKHLGETNGDRFNAFVDGYIACMGDNYLPNKLYTLFRDWLRDIKQEFPEEGWPTKYLRDCHGDHEQAIRKYLDFVDEFAGAPMIDRFNALIADYKQLSAKRSHESTARSAHFRDVCASGMKLVETRLRALSIQLDHWRSQFGAQVPSFDLFQIMGIWGKENRYSDLIAWLCKREGGRGEQFARLLLSRMHPPRFQQSELGPFLRVTREQATVDGRIDLVLEFEGLAVAVEVKVWSSEHETPSGQPQTLSYPKALATKLKKSVYGVLLSPEGTIPLGPDASRLSFFDLASVVLSAHEQTTAQDEKVIIQLFAAHLLELAVQEKTGHSFRELSHALSAPRQDWPPWVILKAPALEKITSAMETPTS